MLTLYFFSFKSSFDVNIEGCNLATRIKIGYKALSSGHIAPELMILATDFSSFSKKSYILGNLWKNIRADIAFLLESSFFERFTPKIRVQRALNKRVAEFRSYKRIES